jgi:hypothetical protein
MSYANFIIVLLALWFSVAYMVAMDYTPREDKRRRGRRFRSAVLGVLLIFTVLMLPQMVWVAYGLLLLVLLLFAALVSGKVREPEYAHPADILLLRRPVRHIFPGSVAPTPRKRSPGITVALFTGVVGGSLLIFWLFSIVVGSITTLLLLMGLMAVILILLVVKLIAKFVRKITGREDSIAATPPTQAEPDQPDQPPQLSRRVYAVGAVVGVLGLVSFLGLSLKPCQWLDRLVQHSGCVRTLTWWPEHSHALATSPTDNLLAYSTKDRVEVIRVPNNTPVYTLANAGYASSLTFSPDGSLLAASGGGSIQHVRVWSLTDGSQLHMFEVGEFAVGNEIASLDFSPDGSLLAVGWFGSVQFWRVADETRVWEYGGAYGMVAFSPDGSRFITQGKQGFEYWHTAHLTRERMLAQSSKQFMLDTTLSPDGTLLAGFSQLGGTQLLLWRISDGTLLHTLEWPRSTSRSYAAWINTVAFSPDNTLVAAGSDGNTVRIWRVADGALVATLDQPGRVQHIAFTSQGELVIDASSSPLSVWRVQVGGQDSTTDDHR